MPATTRFSFDVPYDADDRDLIHRILDLEAGDRIVVKQYQIGTDDDPAANAAADGADPFARPMVTRPTLPAGPSTSASRRSGTSDRTYVDVFLEQHDEKDYSIEIQWQSQALLLLTSARGRRATHPGSG